jgi:hypothetical protein
VLERVVPLRRIWHFGVPETRVVDGQDVEAGRERRDQVAELMRGGREATEQQQLVIGAVARLTIEDADALHLCGVEGRR